MVEITHPPTTLHPSPSSPLIPISPFLLSIFLVAAAPRCETVVLFVFEEDLDGRRRLASVSIAGGSHDLTPGRRYECTWFR